MAGAQHQMVMASASGTALPPARTFLGEYTSTANQTTYTTGSLVVPEDCLLVAMCHRGTSSVTITGVTVGGNAATLYGANPSASLGRIIAARRVVAGSYAVALTLSGTAGTNAAIGMGFYAITGSLASDTPIGHDEIAGASATSRTVTFDRGTGVALFCGVVFDNVTRSYSSATEDLQGNIPRGAANHRYAYASLVTTPGTAVAETITYSATTLGQFQGAAWA